MLAQMLPTFGAAVRVGRESVRACTDALGFRAALPGQGDGWAAVSTSARVLAALGGGGFDPEALAVQSQLGWQLGRRTIFAGVTQLAAGHSVTLGPDGASAAVLPATGRPGGSPLAQAVAQARDLLRGYLAAYLDDHPDAVLQLTGGQDSRLLLSAIEPHRRRGVAGDDPGRAGEPRRRASPRRWRAGTRWTTRSSTSPGWTSSIRSRPSPGRCAPRSAWRPRPTRSRTPASTSPRRGPCPGRASPGWGARWRGGSTTSAGVPRPPSRPAAARRLADWRMFANEAVEPGALDRDFGPWARDVAHAAVLRSLDRVRTVLVRRDRRALPRPPDAALGRAPRRRRWPVTAGSSTPCSTTASSPSPAPSRRRTSAARASWPGSRSPWTRSWLPSPSTDGRRRRRTRRRGWPARSASRGRRRPRRSARPANDWAGSVARPPVVPVLADLVARRWRRDPSMLEDLRGTGIFDAAWLDQVATGVRQPSPGDDGLPGERRRRAPGTADDDDGAPRPLTLRHAPDTSQEPTVSPRRTRRAARRWRAWSSRACCSWPRARTAAAPARTTPAPNRSTAYSIWADDAGPRVTGGLGESVGHPGCRVLLRRRRRGHRRPVLPRPGQRRPPRGAAVDRVRPAPRHHPTPVQPAGPAG